MDQARTQNVRMNRMKGRVRAWLSKPANIILLIFLMVISFQIGAYGLFLKLINIIS